MEIDEDWTTCVKKLVYILNLCPYSTAGQLWENVWEINVSKLFAFVRLTLDIALSTSNVAGRKASKKGLPKLIHTSITNHLSIHYK